MRFMYPWVGSEGGRLAIAVLPLDEDEYYVAAAWCSPKDHFQRRRGRHLASERMGGKLYSKRLRVPKGPSWQAFRTAVAEAVLYEFEGLPKWVRERDVHWSDPTPVLR